VIQILSSLVAYRSIRRQPEHEFGQPVSGRRAIRRIGRELAIERHLTPGEARRVAKDILELELSPELHVVLAEILVSDIGELEQVEIVDVGPKGSRSDFGVALRSEAGQAMIVRGR